MNIWILDSDSGVTLFFNHHMTIPVNEDLISGLLAALNQFTIVELKQPIEAIDMGGLRWVYISDKPSNLLFIGADSKETPTQMLRSRLNVIKQLFIQRYIPDGPKWRGSWNGSIDQFKSFKTTVDEYYEQWLQAENIMNIAEFFDILGIFQQLFNLLHAMVEEHFSEDERVKTYSRIEETFVKFKKNKYINKHEELSKIEFNRISGFNILSINPTNCDFIEVETQIINLTKVLISILRINIDPKHRLLELFHKSTIYDYILNNYTHLKELNLDHFLLDLFLLR